MFSAKLPLNVAPLRKTASSSGPKATTFVGKTNGIQKAPVLPDTMPR